MADKQQPASPARKVVPPASKAISPAGKICPITKNQKSTSDVLSELEPEARLAEIVAELAKTHAEYEDKLQPAFVAYSAHSKALQMSEEFCEKQVKHLLHNLAPLKKQLKSLKNLPASVAHKRVEVESSMQELEVAIRNVRRNLPAQSGFYLYLVLGSMNVNMRSNRLKLNYKIEYETFKLFVTWALLILSLLCLYVGGGSVWDSILLFALVWFYCTLTIRESILKVNGSNINGWWRLYHFIATGLSGIIVLWADKELFQRHFRWWFLVYTCMMLLAHQMQYRYQAGTLYRLQALGDRGNPMEVSVEGIRASLATPMLRDFALLMPFLYAVYFTQFYMVYLLVDLIHMHPDTYSWHAAAAAALFGIMFLGNILTTSFAIYSKYRYHFPDPLELLKKFQ
ncbi:transmembrane protein-like [Tropilaelaps mercedesae]|uniref:Transmembrane protein-like n=1 Tax=Tropilaelaps mercedesae TaxID=418985 RepID=A0A1V9X5Z1_9ACAR|nr:transmembrane protein-like [Tropilaelaps mercedesae]